MSKPYVTLLGKVVRYAARLRGGGSALPGLFVEKIDPVFIQRTLSKLSHGTVLISGTNGKTTTTKLVVELLEGQGLKVFTNRTGSNFTRGVAAALIGEVDMHGNLDADIAVLELDEAHAVHFIKTVPPTYTLLLNVMRDQLDRFGEIDATAKLLQHIAEATQKAIVLNREDPRILAIGKTSNLTATVSYFGLSNTTRALFPNDDDMRAAAPSVRSLPTADIVLDTLSDQSATFLVDSHTFTTNLKLQGIYNVYNAAAALATVAAVMDDDLNLDAAKQTMSRVAPAFGRGETLEVGGQPLELVLVKNPGGFRLGLKSFDPSGYATMIAINDNYADGRDMSWLWDVEFESLQKEGVAEVSGIRAYDMALRLQYDEIETSHVMPALAPALRHFLAAYSTKPKRIYCTYTAMLALRRELAKITTVESVS